MSLLVRHLRIVAEVWPPSGEGKAPLLHSEEGTWEGIARRGGPRSSSSSSMGSSSSSSSSRVSGHQRIARSVEAPHCNGRTVRGLSRYRYYAGAVVWCSAATGTMGGVWCVTLVGSQCRQSAGGWGSVGINDGGWARAEPLGGKGPTTENTGRAYEGVGRLGAGRRRCLGIRSSTALAAGSQAVLPV